MSMILRRHVSIPNSKVHGTNMGPIWGRQDPVGPHVGPMNLAIWNADITDNFAKKNCTCVLIAPHEWHFSHAELDILDLNSDISTIFAFNVPGSLIEGSLASSASVHPFTRLSVPVPVKLIETRRLLGAKPLSEPTLGLYLIRQKCSEIDIKIKQF